jgi:branched-chain amino acid aminotransferase
MTLPAWFGDGPMEPMVPTVSTLDAGLRSGWGVFETFRAHGTATIGRDRHLARLIAGAGRLGIAVDGDRVDTALDRTLARARDVHEVAVRITLTAGPVDSSTWPPEPVGRPTLIVTLHPAPALPRPARRALTVPERRWPADIKSTSYVASIVATRQARAAGADIAVLSDGDELLETAEGNLFALIDGELVTPPTDGRILPGVTRELVLEEATRRDLPVRLGSLTRDDVRRAEVVMGSSAVSGLVTLAQLDGHMLRGAGPVLEGLDSAELPEPSEPSRTVTLHPVVVLLREALEGLRR